MTNLHKNWFKNDCHQIILSQINTYPKFHLQRFQIDQNEEENERMRIRAKTGFRKIRMPLVSLITRKWSCGCNELTDRLLQNFSTSKHARRRNTVPPPSPFSPLSALCTTWSVLYIFLRSTVRDSRPIFLAQPAIFLDRTGNEFLERVFIRSNFAGRYCRIRCTSSLKCPPLAGEILFEWINLSFIGLLFACVSLMRIFCTKRYRVWFAMMIKLDRFLF